MTRRKNKTRPSEESKIVCKAKNLQNYYDSASKGLEREDKKAKGNEQKGKKKHERKRDG